MVVGVAMRQKALACARRWRRVPVRTLRSRLTTRHVGCIRLPLSSDGAATAAGSDPLLNIQVGTNSEEVLRWCQLELFGFFHTDDGSGTSRHSSTSEVCIHSGPPKQLGYPYTLTAEADNFADAVQRDEAHAVWEITSGAESAYPSRWLTQLLLDGFVSRRVVAHVGLSADHLAETVAMSRRLKVELGPSELSPHYFSNDLLSTWGVFGELRLHDAEFCGDCVRRVLQLALASTAVSAYRSVWLNGVAVCNSNGDGVIVLGPRKSGKTTLALHCLAAASKIRLIGLENFHVAPASAVNGTVPACGGAHALLMGLPSSANVGIGSLLGSLRPNPSLVKAAHTFTYNAATIENLMRNSEKTIWSMGRRYPVNISEAFGPRRWCPVWYGRIKGIVLLNWDVEELSRPISSAGAQVIHWSGRQDCYRALLNAFAANAGADMFKGHYLIRSIYNELNAPKQLEEIIFGGDGVHTGLEVPPVFEVRGAVHFDPIVKLICEHLLDTSS